MAERAIGTRRAGSLQGRWRVVAFIALATCVAALGMGGGALAGFVFGPGHGGQASAAGFSAQALATATPAKTPAAQNCQCTGSTLNMPQPTAGIPQYSGKVILVSLSQQWLWAYQDQHLFLASPVTTGMPQLPTPQGNFFVQSKETNVTFYSLWPLGSPFYYSPEHINYALYFRAIGFYIHDAPWRHQFGPGTQYPHTDDDGTQETGSHGCVNMPTPAATVLYPWADVGTRILIVV